MTDFAAQTLPPGWEDLAFFTDDWPALAGRLTADTRPILPAPGAIFAALAACPPDRVRVVILGQDPYPTPGHAHGFAFSVTPETPLPRSLANIYREMRDDLGACPATGDLRALAGQGVLLLNTCLTVPAGCAGGHARLGWDRLTTQVLDRLNAQPRAWLLWGAQARALAPRLTAAEHLILTSAHPSPLSAHRGFFGSRPFSRVNEWLKARGETPIDWTCEGTPP